MSTQAIDGMKSISEEIIQEARRRGVRLTAADFTWNRGVLHEIPALVHMEARAGSKTVSAQWPSLYLEDSWDRVDRWEVRQEIERVVDELVDANT